MNKKLVAVAVAGLFAAPAVALAQSSVTISGVLKGGFENLKLNNFSQPQDWRPNQHEPVRRGGRFLADHLQRP